MSVAFIGSTEDICAVLFPQDQNEHVKAWRWHCFTTGNYHYWPRYSNRIVYGAREAA